MYFCFKSKTQELYYANGLLVDDPKDARPQYGDQGSAFMHADEYFEGNPTGKTHFKRTYEICRIDDNA